MQINFMTPYVIQKTVDNRLKVIDFYLFVRGDNRMYECPVFHTRDRGSSSFVFLSTLRILVKQSDPRSDDELGPRSGDGSGPRSGDESGPRSGDESGPRSGDRLGLQIESSSSGWILSNVALVMHADNRRI